MRRARILQGATLALLGTLSAACATANPWERNDTAAQLRTAAADVSRTCDVEITNATDGVLETSLLMDDGAQSLGLVTSGQSVTWPVACALGRVTAYGVTRETGMNDGHTFRRAARIDLLRATRVRLTRADEVRW
jgi:hypothetical protein